MSILSQSFVVDALQSTEDFPIDFDDVWVELGYSTKQKALNRLEATHDESVDYTLNFKVKRVEGNRGGGSTRYHEIKLSIDGFKSFCMVAETSQGREVRKYFIEIEKEYRASLERQFTAPIAETHKDISEPFPRCMDDLIEATGTSKCNIVKTVKQYLTVNVHYQLEIVRRKHLYFFTQAVYDEMVVSVKSRRGLDLSKCSATITLNMIDFTSHTGRKVPNQFYPSQYDQLKLF